MSALGSLTDPFGSTSAVLHSSQVGHEPTFVDAAHFAAKQTFEHTPARLRLMEEWIIMTRGSEPERRHRSG